MVQARQGAAAVLLADGRVLITGGADSAGNTVRSAELFYPVGAFAVAPPMNVARRSHGAVRLKDGRVLVAGGYGIDGAAMRTAEIYDPTANAWSMVSSLSEPRARFTASLLGDGRVLIAGGDSAGYVSGSIETFNPTTNTFTFAGNLSAPRVDHAAATLNDGRVLIAGGSDGGSALSFVDFYTPSSGSVIQGPPLATARAGHSGTTLLDGTVLVAGGSNGAQDLSTAEVYDPIGGTWRPVGSLATARRNHLAFLLPRNNAVLVFGGTNGRAALRSAELDVPWEARFLQTGSLSSARSGSVGSPLALDGWLLAAGGTGLDTAEVYRFATLRTDRDDYGPGETVTMTGSGWVPGETVTLVLREVPPTHAEQTLTATVDASGNFVNTQFAPERHDEGVTFFLTATGTVSRAQVTFTDSPKVGSLTVGAQTGSLTSGTAGSATFLVTVNRGSGPGSSGAFKANLSVTTALPAGATASFSTSCTGPVTPDCLNFGPADSTKTSTLTITTTGATPAGTTLFTVKASTSATDFATGTGTLTINAGPPQLTVIKTLLPGSDSGQFNLRIDGTTYATNVGNGGTTGAVTLTASLHTVSETAGTLTTLTDYISVIGGDCAADGTITLVAGDVKNCTITNTRKPRLTVIKALAPTSDLGKFNLRIDDTTYATDVGNGGSTGVVTLPTLGAHTVSELAGTGTSLSDYLSAISDDCAADGSITLAAGDVKTCTITNTRKPRLTVTKALVPATDPGKFNLQIDGTTAGTGSNVGNGGTTGVITLATLGAHTVGETAGTATLLNNYLSVIGGACAANGSITLAAGDVKTCTITNYRKVEITGLSASPSSIFPADRRMVFVTLAPTTLNPATCGIVSVAQNTPQLGSQPDFIIHLPLSVELRAERPTGATNRSYLINVSCTDGVTTAATSLFVSVLGVR
ncbi:MAG: hypothetical protein HYS05_02770 [Acidobacteria bacterium]|nr:hypothetical protein [Acidobacteriota bacterium]